MQQIGRMLVQNSTEYKPNSLNFETLEYIPAHLITPPDKPRVLEKSVKIIHLIRNPKDTFASLYTFLGQHKEPMKYEGSWDQFFSVMLDMGFLALKLARSLLIQNTLGCVEKLNEFLELKRSPELCRDICEVCTLTTMKEKEEKLLRQLNITDNGFTDAEDAVRQRDGYNYDGYTLRVEFPRGSGMSRFRGGRGGRGGPPSRRSENRVLVSGLPPTGSWQDLKDHMREAGDVCYADVFKDGTGVVEFLRREDMKYAVRKLDDTKFRSHEGDVSYIRVKEDSRGRSRSRSRSASQKRSRGSPRYSPMRSRSQSFSRSRSPY
ncbi:hypothetical protein C0Q70_06844 [Pomacea canaliculata]|uniref:RRM domain-containing protein n=1 Tax=Pomacea canaliculata TaxID=400727 RepID=A0A2T7PDE1_POMCA|nr:hypothetical protein C0Q70_06844 [Pomacea canaliculata]